MGTEMNFCTQLSDDESDDGSVIIRQPPPEIQGILCKWTNYIHGWQNRYFVLKDGTLSYYKNQDDASFGCRGSISVSKAVVKPHVIDECRFDVYLNDCVWYLRTGSQEEKLQWVDAIELQKENSLRRAGSSISLTSTSLSTFSTKKSKGGRSKSVSMMYGRPSSQRSDFRQSTNDAIRLREKLAELDTYRDILIKQMDTLQSFFDACIDISPEICTEPECNGESVSVPNTEEEKPSILRPSSLIVLQDVLQRRGCDLHDFKGEALTFKATTAGILTTLAHCVELMKEREEAFRRKLEREVERRRQLEDRLLQVEVTSHAPEVRERTIGVPGMVGVGGVGSRSVVMEPGARVLLLGGPDYEEGPHSVMGEDEFYDAVESTLDKMDEEEQFRERLRQRRNMPSAPSQEHPLWPEIHRVTEEQLGYALQEVTDDASDPNSWMLFAQEGEMKLYRREIEVDGLVMDPCKALHQVEGVTAHEMAHHFWSPDVRFEWDMTLEQMTVLDQVDDSTLIFLQVHKRVWPIAQRDALFWSHIRKYEDQLPTRQNEQPYDTWIVCNRSTEHPDAPDDGKCVRLGVTVCFVCHTFIQPPLADGESIETISRDRLLTKIIYCSNLNPGGWAPASVLRVVFKREYPRFVRQFTQYVSDKCRDLPIAFNGLVILNKSKFWRG